MNQLIKEYNRAIQYIVILSLLPNNICEHQALILLSKLQQTKSTTPKCPFSQLRSSV